MSAIAAKPEAGSAAGVRRVPPLATAAELLGIYAGILLYIWRWQYSHPYAWIALLALILLSHILRHEGLREMGLRAREFRACARMVFPLLAVVAGPSALFALWERHWAIALPQRYSWISFATYVAWCCFQQYLMQAYFHRRLRSILKTSHLSTFTVAVMFAGAHIPNPILMTATLVGGFLLAEVYARHPNIWALGLTQAVAGLLIGALAPAGIIHAMRVGPGYYFYNLR